MNISIRKFIIANFLMFAAAILCAALILAMVGIIPYPSYYTAQSQPHNAHVSEAVICDHCDSCGELYPLDELTRIPYEKGEGGSICPSCADYWTMEC